MNYEKDLPQDERDCSSDNCQHSGMISDSYLIGIVFEILLANQQADPEVFERIKQMDENAIK